MQNIVVPYINYNVRGLCLRPYYRHAKGCPNFNKRHDCPPNAPFFDQYYDITKPVYAIYHVFDLKAHVEKMKQNNPNWSQQQLQCVLYWQGHVRKILQNEINVFLKQYPEYTATMTPEAMGVDMTKTMQSIDIILQYPPQDIVYKIALLGIKKDSIEILF